MAKSENTQARSAATPATEFTAFIAIVAAAMCCLCCSPKADDGRTSVSTGETLIYHDIRVDAEGKIVPWNFDDPATAYDDILNRVWTFWDTMRVNLNGLPDYMNHLVWVPKPYEERGIAGDQTAMCMSSWELYYMYTGNRAVRENAQFMAGYYLAHSLSPADCKWPDLPFPQNTNLYSGEYDGDMILGPGFLQPDKAGSFAWELLKLSRETNREPLRGVYLDAAMKIANTLARNIRQGDGDHSPWPFKVNAYTGEVGKVENSEYFEYRDNLGFRSEYTTFYGPTIELFLGLAEDGRGDVELYRKTAMKVVEWMNNYPVKSNKWGPFFEDVAGWSDTQINAVSYAQFLMRHPELNENWQKDVRSILDWVYERLSNKTWEKYGVTAINEQTSYLKPGNSHTSRQACAELQYSALTGDTSRVEEAVRKLNWATYMVDEYGRNMFPESAIWYTDGYGDYVRHYLNAMAACPDLSPAEFHILSSSTGIVHIDKHGGEMVTVQTAKTHGQEAVRMAERPAKISYSINKESVEVPEGNSPDAGLSWRWTDCKKGGYVTIVRKDAGKYEIVF